jgi:MFS family permease
MHIGPPTPFSYAEASHLATVSTAAALSAFGGSLLTQDLDFIGDSFGASDRTLGIALAVVRVGVVVAVLAGILADRAGRRRVFLACTVGAGVLSGVSALAPNLIVFMAIQVVGRGLYTACLSLSTILVIEGAPERARAWSAGILSLAAGTGYAVGLVLLPIGDLGGEAWRVHYVLAAGALVLVPGIARRLRETPRFVRVSVHEQEVHPNRPATATVRRVVDRRYGRRFVLLAVLVYALQVFTAPAAQFANRYLRNERDFSGFDITVFRGVTAGVTGLLGVLIGSRIAETRGRRPVAVVCTVLTIATTMWFYLAGGVSLWVANTVGTVVGGMAVPAMASFGAEMFPTDARGTASGLLLVVGVLGSATGLILAGALRDPLDSLGQSIALLGFLPLVAVVVLLPRLPEGSGRRLDDLSPVEDDP